MSSPGAPTRDVLLVSAIITVSLSVTVVLCGLCHWCQRKLVRLLRAPGGRGLALHPALLNDRLVNALKGARLRPICPQSRAHFRGNSPRA